MLFLPIPLNCTGTKIPINIPLILHQQQQQFQRKMMKMEGKCEEHDDEDDKQDDCNQHHHRFILLRNHVLDYFAYRSVNDEYLSTLPKSFVDSVDGTIYDYEPHCDGIGCYDTPDLTPFQTAFGDSSYWFTKKCVSMNNEITRLSIKNCEQLLCLTYLNDEDEYEDRVNLKLARALKQIHLSVEKEKESKPPLGLSDKDSGTEDPHLQELMEAKQLLSLLESTRVVEMDCEKWHLSICGDSSSSCSSSYYHHQHDGKCLSACFLSLFLTFPNLHALRVKRLHLDSAVSLFANFPSPLEENPVIVAKHLEIISFVHCSPFHPVDLPFLTDCAIEHKVLPELRHLQCYYCDGMTYQSVCAASEAMNLDFDRFECSGWCWPQEAVNKKNRDIHC